MAMTKTQARARIKMCRENLRGMEQALRDNDAEAFEDWYGQLMGDADMAAQYFTPKASTDEEW